MPFTPFHFGPSAVIALPLNRYIDIPAFLLANIAVDIEPLAVMSLSLSYPLHGYAHSILVVSIIGVIFGLGLYHFGQDLMYKMCAVLFIPALAIYGE